MDEIGISIIELEESRLTPDPIPQAPYGLVVDDNPLVADTLAEILRSHGYTASVAYDGEEALQLALLAPPDFVISDVFMPRLTGVELAVRLLQVDAGLQRPSSFRAARRGTTAREGSIAGDQIHIACQASGA